MLHLIRLPHAHAVWDTVILRDFPEEGTFRVTQAEAHNLYNNLPCYQLTAPDGSTIDRITEDRLTAKP